MKGIDARNERAMRTIAALLDDLDLDRRLTPGQMHAAAVEALGCEPIVFACNLLAMSIDARSKITIAPGEAARLALAVVDRLYGPPAIKAKQPGADSFQLEFAWVMPAAAEEEKA